MYKYLTGIKPVGFRGVADGFARLIAYDAGNGDPNEIWFWTGIDVAADRLPYLPDIGPGSDFENQGSWHHYAVKHVFIGTIPHAEKHASHIVIVAAIHFEGEDQPRLLSDFRQEYLQNGLIKPEDMEELNQLAIEKGGINLTECLTFS